MPFSTLFSTFQCGQYRLKNRLVMAPFTTGMERHANIRTLIDFYVQRALAGASMITIPEAIIHKTGKRFSYERVFDEQLDIPRHRLLADALHQHDCLAIMQLVHRGRMADSRLRLSSKTTKTSWRAPSFLLKRLIRQYGIIAERVIRSHYDGVEIDASQQSLLADFLSPVTNRRKDEWGRSQLARFKLALDIVRCVRRSIGPDKLIGFRFNLIELSPKGADWAETTRLVHMLRMAGVDYFCAEFGNTQQTIPTAGPNTVPGIWNGAYKALAAITDLPVVFGQDLGNPSTLNELAQSHENALFELSTALIADPHYIHKIQSNCQDSVTPCLRCFLGCQKTVKENTPIFCPVNPFLFHSFEQLTKPAQIRKRILVVGAGIAGIAFSIFAAKRGHKVDLHESDDRIGGQLQMMGKISGKQGIVSWLAHLNDELPRHGVTVSTNSTIHFDRSLENGTYDACVIATGSFPKLADIEGIGSSNVLTFDEVLSQDAPVGHRVGIIGINALTLDLAKFLTESKDASPLTPAQWLSAWGVGDIAQHRGGVLGVIPSIQPPKRQLYLFEAKENEIKSLLSKGDYKADWQWILMNGAQTFQNVNFETIDNYSIRVSFGNQHKESLPIRVDHVVLCTGQTPNRRLVYALQSLNLPTYQIGACSTDSGYQTIPEIIQNAFTLACEL